MLHSLRSSALAVLLKNKSPKNLSNEPKLSFQIQRIQKTNIGDVRLFGKILEGSLKVSDIIAFVDEKNQPVFSSKGYGYHIKSLKEGAFNKNEVKNNADCNFCLNEDSETNAIIRDSVIKMAVNLQQDGGQIVFNKELLVFCNMIDENDFYYVNQGQKIKGNGDDDDDDIELLELLKLEYQEICYSGLGYNVGCSNYVKAQWLFLATMYSLYFIYRQLCRPGISLITTSLKTTVGYAKETIAECFGIYRDLKYKDLEYETAAMLVRMLDIVINKPDVKLVDVEIEKLPQNFDTVDYALFSSELWCSFCKIIKEFCLNQVETMRASSSIVSGTVGSSTEDEYIQELKEMLAEGEISARERRLLNKIRTQLGISESRAAELEASLTTTFLTTEEQEYFNEYKEIISEGEISPRDQRYLDKLKKANCISDSRAKEIESMA